MQLSGRALVGKFAALHDLSFPGWWPARLASSRNVFHMYTLDLHEFLFTLRFIYVKNILELGRGIFENHCTCGHADAFDRHVSNSLIFKAWVMGRDQGREIHREEEILFLPLELIRIFSLLLSCNERDFIYVTLKTCNTRWTDAYKYARQHH